MSDKADVLTIFAQQVNKQMQAIVNAFKLAQIDPRFNKDLQDLATALRLIRDRDRR